MARARRHKEPGPDREQATADTYARVAAMSDNDARKELEQLESMGLGQSITASLIRVKLEEER